MYFWIVYSSKMKISYSKTYVYILQTSANSFYLQSTAASNIRILSQKKVPEILLVNDEIDHGNTTDMMQSEDVIDKQVYKVSTLYPFDISVNDGISKKSVTVNFDTINADNVTK